MPAGEPAKAHPWPTSVEVGRQHKNYSSGTLRAGVFGVNDGLVSNTLLVMGAWLVPLSICTLFS
ncbi:MAG: hypothetical protein R3D30_12275 [Hyphomicrobiales bacterium]